MAKHPAVLIDDPVSNHHYDLARALRGWRGGLVAVITPVEGTGTDSSNGGTAEAYVGKNDSESTRTLKNAAVRYRIAGKRIDEREFEAAEGAAVLAGWAPEAPVVVSFVSYATTPLIVALAHSDAFKSTLRVGVTGVRLDSEYNLARKLMVDELIHYHEHTRTLEKVLNNRLQLMLNAHRDRQGAGSA